ncbi:MAG: hypothetical protein KBD19_03560 [Candidatus Moranbacteria bacterium]|nr:hypothetical protein [Candidatus Moranbacteria bacterium]
MKKTIRHRHVRSGRDPDTEIRTAETPTGKTFPGHVPDINPKSMTFMLGLIFFLEPEKGPERELFPEGERFVCD